MAGHWANGFPKVAGRLARASACASALACLLFGCVAPEPKAPPRDAGPTDTARDRETAAPRVVESPEAPKPDAERPKKPEPPTPPAPATSVKTGTMESAFDDAGALAGWELTGDAKVDPAGGRDGRGGALRVGPGGRAVLKLRDADGSGRVDFWVHEDVTLPKDPKARRVGPRWGLLREDGKVFGVGIIYAPYLAGDRTYATTDYDGKTWFRVQYLGECRRARGWRRWTFDMDAQDGLTILLDGEDVNAKRKRFDWNRTGAAGFAGVVFLGDAGKGTPHTLLVDDLTMDLGGAMAAKPTPPPPPPPVTPEKDPAPEERAERVELVEAVRGKHPRLLFSGRDVATMKRFARGPGKPFFDELCGYLASSTAPSAPKFLGDATDAQRQGLWRAPTAALHYVLTGERGSFEKARGFMELFLRLDHWETGKEQDAGMGAANIMIGAALAYDWLYHDLDPAFRKRYRAKLLLHARRMYHRGHLNKGKSIGYWQADPQNNHRWHRDAGLALCALAAADEGDDTSDDDWILAKTKGELDFVAKWLPPDGTSHESASYLVFGGAHLTLAMQASDRCFGTRHLDLPFFKNVGMFRLQSLAPGLKEAFHFGDSGGLGGYNNFLYKHAATHGQRDVQAGLAEMRRLNPKAWWLGWLSLVWRDPDLAGGSVDRLPKAAFYPDLGLAYVRDGWGEGGVGAMFKCGPYGGYRLNEYRNSGDFRYINVAHDDPDANSFLLYAGGKMLAETSRYSKKKLTRSHNTILVNGKGQRGEGQGWTQPFKRGDKDMTKIAIVTAWKDSGDVALVEGEAGGSYPDLTRFRRTFVWVRGAYVLVLDDIRAEKDVEVTWLVQGPGLDAVEESTGRYRLGRAAAARAFKVVADGELASEIADATADHRGKPLGWKQLRLSRKAARLRVASVYDAWDLGKLDVAMDAAGPDVLTVKVTGPGIADTWRLRAAEGRSAPNKLEGRRKSGAAIVVDDRDAPPKP
ncbi:MAG: heparinase II/III domain-containing protein [Planctomycetota bacterium]|jgi:hypothetical protein